MYRLRSSLRSVSISLTIALAALFLPRCGGKKSTEPEVRTVKLETPFEIGLGENVTVEGTDFIFSLQGVSYDFRCPPSDECDWVGVARVDGRLNAGSQEATVPLYIEGVSSDASVRRLATKALGLTIRLNALVPYQKTLAVNSGSLTEIRANITLSQVVPHDSNSGSVVITSASPGEITQDQFELESAAVSHDLLRAVVSYSGGCSRHFFYAYMTPSEFLPGDPLTADLYFRHFDNYDECDAAIKDTLWFDLTPIKQEYERQFNQVNPIVIRVHQNANEGGTSYFQLTYLQDAASYNYPPSVSYEPEQTVVAGENLQIPVSAFDPEGDSISFVLTNSTSNCSLTADSPGSAFINFSPSVEDSGEVSFEVLVSDGNHEVSVKIHVEVQAVRLTLSGPDTWSLSVGAIDTLSYQISYNGSKQLESYAIGPMQGLKQEIIGDHTLIVYNELPLAAEVRNLQFYVAAGQITATKILRVQIEENAKPVLHVADSMRVIGGTLDTLLVTATDADGDELTLSIDYIPYYYELYKQIIEKPDTLLIVLEPTRPISTWTLKVHATDGAWVVTDTVVLVEDFAEDLPPEFSISTPESVYVGARLAWRITVHDDHPDFLEIAEKAIPDIVSFSQPDDTTALLGLTPTMEMLGNYPISIHATDGRNSVVFESEFSVVVFDESMMRFGELAQQEVYEGHSISIPITILNPAPDTRISLASSTPYAEVIESGVGLAELKFNAPANSAENYVIYLKAEGGNLQVFSQVSFAVRDFDVYPPYFPPHPTLVSVVDYPSSFGILIKDGDGEPELLQVSITGLPGDATYTTASYYYDLYAAQVNYTPNAMDVGVYTFTVTATDPGELGLTSQEEFRLYVHDIVEGSGQLMPTGVGASWVYEFYSRHFTCGVSGVNCQDSRFVDTIAVTVTSVDTAQGLSWWNTDNPLPGIGHRYAIRNDSLFVSSGTATVLKTWRQDGAWFGFNSDGDVELIEPGLRIAPFGAYGNAIEIYNGKSKTVPVHTDCNEQHLDFVAGVGVLGTNSCFSSGFPMCGSGCGSETTTTRLLEFHPAPD